MMSEYIWMLLEFEALVCMIVLALATPIMLGWMLHSAWNTYRRNRR
jgi:hypothetical protein